METTEERREEEGKGAQIGEAAGKVMLYTIVLFKTKDFLAAFSMSVSALLVLFYFQRIYNAVLSDTGNLGLAVDVSYLLVAAVVGVTIGEAIIAPSFVRRLKVVLLREVNRLHGLFSVRVAKLLVGVDRFQRLVVSYVDSLRGNIVASGEVEDGLFFVTKYLAYSLLSAAYVVFAGSIASLVLALTGYLYYVPLLVPAVAIPVFLYYYPSLYYRAKRSELGTGVNNELPFFAVLLSIASSTGLTIDYVMRRILQRGRDIFPKFFTESKMALRDLMDFGRPIIGEMEERAKSHPSREFSAFLFGYSTMFRTGGELPIYLTERAKELTEWLAFRWELYSERVASLGETTIIVFFVVPVMLIVTAMFAGTQLLYDMVVLPPLFTLVLYVMVRGNRPTSYDTVTYDAFGAIGIGVGVGLLSYFLYADVSASSGPLPLHASQLLFLSLLLPSLYVYLRTRGQFREIDDVEGSIPEFLRDLTEFRKIGQDVSRTMRILSGRRKYRSRFNGLLEGITKAIDSGTPLTQVEVRTRSYLGRFVFFMVRLLVESGNVEPTLLENLSSFASRYVQVKEEAKARMRIYRVLGLLTPVMLTFAIVISAAMAQSFGAGNLLGGAGAPAGSGLQPVQLTGDLLQVMFIFVEGVSFGLGLVVSKAMRGTVADMSMAILGLLIAIASIAIAQLIQPAVSGFFTPP